MNEDLQSLLEKINREGLEKAEAEAAKILGAAKEKASALIQAAKAEAQALKAEAEKAAADYAERAAQTIRQGARDTVNSIEQSVTSLLDKLLVKNVETALADPALASSLVIEAIRGLSGPGEITCGEKLAKALAAQQSALGNFTISTEETAESGFSVKLDGGRVEHSFKGAVIAEELARRLRPDLAKLVK